MHKLTITRENGGVPKSLAGEDHVSGIVFYVKADTVPEAFKTEPRQAVSTLSAAEALGITGDEAAAWDVKMIHYQLSEIFRVNPAISLYVAVIGKTTGVDFTEIKELQNHASGSIRQMAVWNGHNALTADDLTLIQGVADALDTENAPLSVLYAPKVTDVGSLEDLRATGQSRVSVVIGQAGSGTAATLHADTANIDTASVTCTGVALGLLSRAAVHQSFSWVKEFPTGISLPAFSDGTLYRNTDKAVAEQLDAAGYIFPMTHVSLAGSYLNDSPTMDLATSDYATIEAVRTMDKAVRGVRTYLIPELGGNVYVDSSTGKMQAYSVEHLQLTAGRALEDMEKAGELSGYIVEIDPEQDVLSTSTVEIVIRQVAVGVMRRINVKIGFTASVE